MTHLTHLISALYRAHHPCRDSKYGSRAWFIDQLAEHGIEVAPSSLHRWEVGGVPDFRAAEIDAVLRELHRSGREKVREGLDAYDELEALI